MPKPRTWTDDQLRDALPDCLCWKDLLVALGLRAAGGNLSSVKRHVERLQLSTAHFDPDIGRRRGRENRKRPLAEVLTVGSSFSRGHVKQRLYAEGLKDRHCELCGQGEEWFGRRMALILDHVNGVHDDNRLENLRIVCPNCNAALDTHCGRNVALLIERPRGGCGGTFRPRAAAQRFCSHSCSAIVNLTGVARPERRVVERPPYEQLVEETRADGFSAVGRRYGVSDNAVRKWLRAYERERAIEAPSDQ